MGNQLRLYISVINFTMFGFLKGSNYELRERKAITRNFKLSINQLIITHN